MGLDASTKLRENPETSHIPIIALSASTSQDLPESSEFDDYLMKPVNIDPVTLVKYHNLFKRKLVAIQTFLPITRR